MGFLLAWFMAAQATALAVTTILVAPAILPPADTRGVTSLSSPNWGKPKT